MDRKKIALDYLDIGTKLIDLMYARTPRALRIEIGMRMDYEHRIGGL